MWNEEPSPTDPAPCCVDRGQGGTGVVPFRELALAFVGSLALAVLATALDGWPAPRVFDEFSLILSGDTFARGRLTNPPHPYPQFFETIHVLQRPTYASKYFPGHGLALAFGIVLGGGARLGQWLAFALMGPALLWMLRGWTGRRSAIVATTLALLLLADSPWASGYWGSALTVTGSALLFGALPRIVEAPRTSTAVALGVGLVLMALTRPFEGLAVCVVPALFLAGWLLVPAADRLRRLRLVAVPTTLVLVGGAALLAAHNHAVTGEPLRTGYAAYEAGAPGAPPFVWQAPIAADRPLRVTEATRLRIDLSAHRAIRAWWSREMRVRLFDQTLPYYFPHPLFGAVLLLAPFGMRRSLCWVAAFSALLVGVATGVSSFFLPHYIAPALPPLLLLGTLGVAVLSGGRNGGRAVGALGVAGFVMLLGGAAVVALARHDQDERELANDAHWSRRREALARQLLQAPGRHLVFVRYGESYRAQDEWVQNGADLTGGKVLWAHDLGAEENTLLLRHDADRTPWLLHIENSLVAPPTLRPYGATEGGRPILPDPRRGRSLTTPPY